MFPEAVYVERRRRLREHVGSGVLLFLGNELSPINYDDNCFPFRQDSSFLYYFGLDEPGLAAVIDVDSETECVFGNDLTVEEIVWTGPQPPLREKCGKIGVAETAPPGELEAVLKGRKVHFLPQYQGANILKIHRLLGLSPRVIHEHVSEPLIRAVVAQRSVKSLEEIEQIEAALEISYQMQTEAMRLARPDVVEREVAAAMQAIALSQGVQLAFPTIFSVHGETLHNLDSGNVMRAGDMAVNDSGAESPLRYASDVTRTIPVGGKFSPKQHEVYSIVLHAQTRAIAAIKPSVEFREIHRLACVALTAGLRDLGLVKGDVEEAVKAGAHTLFFQCGLGHMMGLDVHDMQGLGEDRVGYTDEIKRSNDFGWGSLRLAKAVEPGFVVTVEPGVYFIPALIDRWQAERKLDQFINYDAVEEYRHFGGVRIEDDVLVTADGCRLLGTPIPKTVEEVEALASA
ncbi:MAG: aminopeptidase P family protein [Sedimentisphaerales bacterium]|nr:aminopeptidase P family protein [Sedimentisphaerales bacterium]